MSKKEDIIKLYYDENYNIIEISNLLNVTKQYVSKIVRKDERHSLKQMEMQRKNKEKRIIAQRPYKQAYKKKKRLEKKENNSYDVLMLRHLQATIELSGRKTISNRAFRNWNPSIYQFHYKTKEYRIKEEFKDKVSYAIPKKIKWE